MTDDERVTVMQIEEEKDQFSETKETVVKEKKPRKRKTQEEKEQEADQEIEKLEALLKAAKAKKARLSINPKEKRASDNHCIYTLGGLALMLWRNGDKDFTRENFKNLAYQKLKKHLQVEFLNRRFK